MGRKVHPIGFRLGYIKDWQSKWFADRTYTDQLHEDIMLRASITRELANAGKKSGRKLYIMDEPTTGLHLDDIRKLAEVMDRLMEQGHTILLIEHNLDVIKLADWVIDLGPEGGAEGGRLVAMGRPEEIVGVKESYTGQWLAPLLRQQRRQRNEKLAAETLRRRASL